MKPTAKSQGKGIFLFNKLSSIQEWMQNPEVIVAIYTGSGLYMSEIYIKSAGDRP